MWLINRIRENNLRFQRETQYILKVYIVGIILFGVTRLMYMLSYKPENELSRASSDLLPSFLMGARFDTVVLCYSFLFLFLLTLVNLFLPADKHRLQIVMSKIYIGFTVFVFLLLSVITIVDFYFFKFFFTHFNVSVFGLADDDTSAIFKSIWTDYPVIRILILTVALTWLFVRLSRFLFQSNALFSIRNSIGSISYFFLFIGMYAIGLRNSLGNVPLEYMQASISTSTFINSITMNGVFALKNAVSERKKGEIDVSEKAIVNRYGYKNFDELLQDFSVKSRKSINPQKPWQSLESHTVFNQFLQDNPPNVIVLQMESMSSYFMKLHSSEFNMLGSLEKELPKCNVFNNFISCRNLTVLSLEGILVNSPLSPLAQSQYLNTSFQTAAVKPFKVNGYETIFATGGRINWRNLDQFLPHQGFDRMEGGADLLKNVSNAVEEHEWGVYDEYLMQRIVQILKEKNNKPKLIYGMTITYHTPYKVPSNYKPYPASFGSHFKESITSTDSKTLETFICYQYMCNSLGWLINQISNSDLADNTIIIATGDHSSHVADQYFRFSDSEIMDWYGVPLICYIPEKYKKFIYIDESRFGSHKDIFPSLYNLCLSNASYYQGGNNLFSSDTTADYFGTYEGVITINKYGCSRNNGSTFTFYNWKDTPGGLLTLASRPAPDLLRLAERSRAECAFNTYSIIQQIKNGVN